MNGQSPVQWHVEDGVGHISFHRAEAANAMNAAFGETLREAIAQATRADIGAIVLSATGAQFCAGGDIHEFLQSDDLAGLPPIA